MGRTPDAYDGPRVDEAVIWEEQASDPTEALKSQYVTGKGLVILEDGVVRGIGEGRENTWQPPVDARNVNTPPGSPATGYRVIIGSSPTGAFAGRPGEIAQWNGSAWVFTTPKQGSITTVKSENEPYKQTATTSPWSWEIVVSGGVVPDIVAFSGYDSAGGTSIVSGWTDVPLDSERKKTSDFAHTTPSAEVTVNRDDTFIIAATVATEITTGTSRSDSEMRVQIDTGGGYVTVPGTQLVIYNRTAAQGKGAVTKVFVIDLSTGDKVKVQARRLSGGSTVALQAGSELVISTTRGPQGPAGPGDDEKVKVTSNDTTADYLFAKLSGGRLITVTELNDGGNEQAEIAVGLHAANHEEGGDDEMDVTDLSGVLADDQPPQAHDLGGAKHNADTLANLNSKITDATLDDSGDPRDPNPHASTHEDGGADEISVADLSGRLADAQNADALQGRDVSSDAPTDGQVLAWRNASSEWGPEDSSGGDDEYQLDEDSTTRSTTTTGLDLAHRFTTSALAGGTYRVAWYYTWSYDRAANDFKGQVSVGGTVVGFQQQEPADAGSDQRNVTSGFAEIVLTAGAKDIDLEYGTTLAAATATIYISRLEIVRVS
jgi:hypothetical protein